MGLVDNYFDNRLGIEGFGCIGGRYFEGSLVWEVKE